MSVQGGIMLGMQKSLSVSAGSVTVKIKLSKKEYDKIYNLKNREKRKQRYLNNKEKFIERSKQYNLKNKERIREQQKQWRLKNKEHHSELNKQWRLRNKDLIRIKDKKRRDTNITYKLTLNLRRRVLLALQGKNKSSSTLKLLGCTPKFLKKYLESKFKQGMSWDNRHEWHIDHIRPCASFDLTDQKQQAKCFHYTNLQPLWAQENMSKGAKW